ncbi:MAG: helix-turn-helix domain-containing protein [Rhodanobacteraceae bacterium]|nr:MAG: helix-turn-helix domain-containing protein [Rhodanobacteraceae bacterium]
MTINDSTRLVADLRARLNLSQEQLAARLNVAFATVNRWELGKSKPQKAQRDALLALAAEAGLADSDTPTATPARIRRGVAHSVVLGNKSMEQMLWNAACQIRGEKDAPKFKDYLLPLLFLKRLSDVFDDEVQRLGETYGDRGIALTLIEDDPTLVRFYVPPECRWAVVSGRENFKWRKGEAPKTLGEQLTLSVRRVARQNPLLAGVIDQVDFAHIGAGGEREISDKALKGVVETFSDPRYRLGLTDVEPDFLGRCYEYLLRKFAEGQGQSAGEFFTPREVGFLMAEILRPRPGEEAYDYACGSFGLLIKLQLVCRRLDPLSKIPLKLYGQELTGSSYAIACMNRIIHDMQGEVLRGDSMRNPKYREGNALKRFDLIVANPMWNQAFDPAIYDNDPFNRFEATGGITTGKADWAWLQHTLASMQDNARAAVVLDTGAVTRGSGSKNEDKERNIRRWFVEHDCIDGVILLPDNLFYNTTAAGIVVVLRKGKPKDRAGRIVLVNAAREFRKGTPKNYLTDDAVAKIAKAYLKGEPQDGLVAVIDRKQAAENDYNLSPSRYIANGETKQLREIPDIVAELAALKKEETALDAELDKVLAKL